METMRLLLTGLDADVNRVNSAGFLARLVTVEKVYLDAIDPLSTNSAQMSTKYPYISIWEHASLVHRHGEALGRSTMLD
jgi:hypothetical protein